MYLLGVKKKKMFQDVLLRVLLQGQPIVPQKSQFWLLIFLCASVRRTKFSLKMPETHHKFVYWLCNNIIYFILMQSEELTFRTKSLVTFVTVYLKILHASPVFECNRKVLVNSILTQKLNKDILKTQAQGFEDVALFYSAAGHAFTNMKKTLF